MKLFTAEWCGPCKMLKQWLRQQNIEGIKIIDIDSDEGGAEARAVGVKGIPALYADGKLIVTNENIRPFLLENK